MVTGASGFVGRSLVQRLANEGHAVRAAMRQPADIFPRAVEVVAVSDLTRSVDWRHLLKGCDTVVHLAGIAHAGAPIPDDLYDRVNRIATSELAAEAQKANIRRMVFASSIRAQSGPAADHVLTENDNPNPTDAYGRSKLKAENAIRQSGTAFTIFRPVLVYGEGVKGNLAALLRLAQSPWPLPFASFTNRRSMLSRENLISAILFALKTEKTIGETYIVADPEPLSVADTVSILRRATGRPPGLVPIPRALFHLGMKAAGRADMWDRIGGQMIASPAKLIAAGWEPVVETRAGLAAMAQAASPVKSGTASRRTR